MTDYKFWLVTIFTVLGGYQSYKQIYIDFSPLFNGYLILQYLHLVLVYGLLLYILCLISKHR